MTKTYQSIAYLNFEFELIIDEKLVKVPFTGGRRSPDFFPGRFITSDKNLQKALEGNDANNSLYKLVEVDGKILQKGAPKYSLDERLVKLENENKEWQRKYSELLAEYNVLKEEPIPGDGLKEVPDITNAQQAKEYLVSLGADPEKMKNKMLIQNRAKKLKVTFPDWK